jgi:type I restriction enzyme R subunit
MNAVTPEGLDIEDRFKDPDDPLQLVFVCAMWLTGFDVESLSTLYLDKPMKGHTLMQAIARANRVHPGKPCGISENGPKFLVSRCQARLGAIPGLWCNQ